MSKASGKTVRSRWQGALIVCRKCSRKLGGGFGPDGDRALAKALRKRLGKGPKARLGVVETGCLKLCPKGAVALVDTRRPGRWHVVPAGEDVDALIDRFDAGAPTPD